MGVSPVFKAGVEIRVDCASSFFRASSKIARHGLRLDKHLFLPIKHVLHLSPHRHSPLISNGQLFADPHFFGVGSLLSPLVEQIPDPHPQVSNGHFTYDQTAMKGLLTK